MSCKGSGIKSIAPAVQGRLSTPQNSAASLLVKKSHIHPRREKQVATQPANRPLVYTTVYCIQITQSGSDPE